MLFLLPMKRFSPLSLVGALLLAVGCDAPAPRTADDFTLALYSSVRLEYTSGGRVVAGSNPVTPTTIFPEASAEKQRLFCCGRL